MRCFLILIYGLFGCVFTALSQEWIKGTVVDETNHFIPLATISTLHGVGVVCDSIGHFEFNIPANESPDLIVQALGYISDTLKWQKEKSEIICRLSQRKFLMQEVAVVHTQNIKDRSMVSTITTYKADIVKLNPQNVCEVLQTAAGFTNRNEYQAPLVLRGLSGKRLLVLRNGIRRFSSYPAGYMSHTINVYDLDRIEIEKGAASVAYGAGAIAGVVNLIDKSPFKQNGLNAKFTSGYGTINNEKNLLACGGWSDGKFAIKTGLRYRDAGNFKYPDGTTAENSFYTDKDLFFASGYQFSERQNIVFTADIHDGGPWGKAVGFNGTNYMRVQTKDELNYNYNLKYSYQPSKLFKDVGLDLFYSDEKRTWIKNYFTAAGYILSYVQTTNYSDYYYGTRLTGKLPITGKYSLNTGAEFYSFHISTPTDAVSYIENLSFSNRVSENARSYTTGVFAENVVRMNDRIKLVAGIRYDYATVFEGDVYSLSQDEEQTQNKNALSGNLAVSALLGNYSQLKINLARSFRMPESTELYADGYSSNGIVYGNSDLKPEYCKNIDITYNYSRPSIQIEVSPFIWLMNDMISKEEISGSPGTNYQYVNIGKARMWGGEVVVNMPFRSLFTDRDEMKISIGAAYLNGTDVTEHHFFSGSGTPLDYVPPFNVKTNISYHFSLPKDIACDFGLNTIGYTEQTRLGSDPYATPSYIVVGCTLGANFTKIKSKPTINFSINNLLSKTYYCYYSYLPSEGRDFRLFLTFHFK